MRNNVAMTICEQEDWRGHKLDREMLELLRWY